MLSVHETIILVGQLFHRHRAKPHELLKQDVMLVSELLALVGAACFMYLFHTCWAKHVSIYSRCEFHLHLHLYAC